MEQEDKDALQETIVGRAKLIQYETLYGALYGSKGFKVYNLLSRTLPYSKVNATRRETSEESSLFRRIFKRITKKNSTIRS